MKNNIESCTWIQEIAPDGDDVWETGCGEAFQFENGAPKENGFVYCPYCGKKLIARLVGVSSDYY